MQVMSVNDRLPDLTRRGILVGQVRRFKNILCNANVCSLMLIPTSAEFAHLCLPASVVLGFYRRRHFLNKMSKKGKDFACHEDARTYNRMKQINQFNHSGAKKNQHASCARKVLLQETKKLCSDLGYDSRSRGGPYPMEEFLETAAAKLNVQFQIYSNQGSRRIYIYPAVDFGAYPRSKVYVLGINASF